jgi:hypothetical protein
VNIEPVIRKRLIALSRCAGDPRDARAFLAALAFCKAEVWATDQFVLGRIDIPHEDGPDERRVIAAADLAKQLRGTKSDDEVTLDFEAEYATLTISTKGLFGVSWRTVTFPYADGKYPSAEQIASLITDERGSSGTPPAFNPDRLAQVAALATDGFVQLHWRAPKPTIVVTGTGGVLLGLVMGLANVDGWKGEKRSAKAKVSA